MQAAAHPSARCSQVPVASSVADRRVLEMPRTWTVWGVEAALDVTLPAVATAAERIVHSVTDDVDRACSRFRSDSELSLLGPQLATGARLSPTLRTLVEADPCRGGPGCGAPE